MESVADGNDTERNVWSHCDKWTGLKEQNVYVNEDDW